VHIYITHICIHVHLWICVDIGMYSPYMCTYVYIVHIHHTPPHTKMYTCTYLHICITFAQTSILAHIYCTYMYTCTSMDMHRHRYVQPVHVYLCVYCTHTPYTCVYVYIHTYVDVHIYTPPVP